MGKRRQRGPKKRSVKNGRWIGWLNIAAAVGKIVQVVISFFHGTR